MLAEAARLRPGLAALAAPKALIVPHAGYIYSGPVAAAGYARPASHAGQHRRIVLLGPGHRHGFRGLALPPVRSEEHTSELQSLMRISYAVFCLKKTNNIRNLISQTSQTSQTTNAHDYAPSI